MSDTRGIPGSRRANNSGGISVRRLSTGELKFHVRWQGKHLGTFASRAQAEAALAAVAGLVMIDEVGDFNAEQFEACLAARGKP
jgi:hypothetical protein